jgi:hypothetical protein
MDELTVWIQNRYFVFEIFLVLLFASKDVLLKLKLQTFFVEDELMLDRWIWIVWELGWYT